MKIIQTPVSRPVVKSPAARAAVTAGLYLVICAAYIVVSGQLAEQAAATPGELRQIETFKGVAFVVVTAAVFYLVSLARWRRIRHQEDRLIEQQEALVRSEQRMSTALHCASLAHDLGNLLFALQGLVEKLEEHEARDPTLGVLHTDLDEAIGGLSALSQRIAASARDVLPEDESDVEVQETLERLARLARHHPDLRRTSVRAVDVPAIRLRLNASMFEDALLNLVINGGQATGPDGHVEIRVHGEGGDVCIEVHDDGPGVADGDAERIFVPCYTTKPDGTGLGLLSVQAFAASCGGDVRLGRSELGGAVFTLSIPRERPQHPM